MWDGGRSLLAAGGDRNGWELKGCVVAMCANITPAASDGSYMNRWHFTQTHRDNMDQADTEPRGIGR